MMYQQNAFAKKAIAICLPITALVLVAVGCSVSKKAKKSVVVSPVVTTPAVVKPKIDSVKNAIKPYKEIVTAKAISKKGLFTIHQVDGKYYFEIADSIFGREIMLITRLSKSTPGARSYGGEEMSEQTIAWEKGPANNVFLKVITLINTADSTSQIYKAVTGSNMYPIAAAFDIKALGKDSSSVLIDVTDLLKGDNALLGFTAGAKRGFNLGALAADRSYIVSVNSYPLNTEIRSVKTYSSTPLPNTRALPATYAAGAVTTELNNSFILLPKVPMKKRLFDYRVGFFADEYNVYSDDQQQVKTETYIHRWRLEAKPEDIEKWKRGELVEPAKQIVYYIDPATPKQWRPYLIAGINDWQKAFEKAGFKNAIVGKEWPENDTTMSLDDARFSVIRYFATDEQNAYGPNIADPRSGEIIESHIGWYHNVMKLVHDWYMIQAGAIDKRAQKMVFDEDLMGQLIRFVSSHEIGHTLGLRHNMGASSATPVEKLRDKKWVEEHGHTASIMDYARFNYVAQPEDNISEVGIFPRIGDYDKWAIEWGYKPILEAKSTKEETAILNKWIIDSLKNPRLWFSGEGRDYDPRSQSEDLGDNSMIASEYGLKNLKRIVPKLLEWTKEKDGDDYYNLAEMYKQVFRQYSRYNGHVLKNLAGVYQTAKSVDQAGALYSPTPKAIQKQAIAYFNEQVFATPYWLLDSNILGRINNPALDNPLLQEQSLTLSLIMSPGRLTRITSIESRYPDKNMYTVDEELTDIEAGIWQELYSAKAIDFYRRKLQRAYIGNLIVVFDPSTAAGGLEGLVASMGAEAARNSDVRFIARNHVEALKKAITANLSKQKDTISKQHLASILITINKALDDKKK